MDKPRQNALEELLWHVQWWFKFLSTVLIGAIILFSILFYYAYTDYYDNHGHTDTPFLVENGDKHGEIYIFITCPNINEELILEDKDSNGTIIKM